MDDFDFSITIVGLGLIGGSFAKALRKLKPRNLWGIDIDRYTIDAAEKTGVVDKVYTEPEIVLGMSDIVIIALYPDQTTKFMRDNIRNFKEGAIITDVGGIKSSLVREISSFIPESFDFIGGHPMAGKESKGLKFASADIFEGASYILTPVEINREENIEILENIIRGIGCKNIIRISPEKHDEIIAYTSQLPHILAVSLVNSGRPDLDTSSFMGGSFRDATRVADINPSLWMELLISNRCNIIKEIEAFEENITAIKNAILYGDELLIKSQLEKANQRRRELTYKNA